MSKYDRQPLVIPIQETPMATYPFQILHIDIFQIENQHYISSLDKFSKYGRMTPIRSRNAIHVEPALWNAVTSFVVPENIVTDNERSFQTANMRGKLLDLNIKIYLTPSNKSEVNGPVERFHSTIIELYRIQKQVSPGRSPRDTMRIVVEKYNNTIHSSTTKTPKEIVFGKSRTPDRDIDPDRLEETRQKIYDEVLVKLKEAQQRLLSSANRKAEPPPHLEIGQKVFVKDKIIRAKHKPKFEQHFVQQNREITFRDENNSKLHKSNVKNILLH